MNEPLSKRASTILELIVRDYIKTAEPVGSEVLVKRYGLSLSPATVRKVMAELEERGLLAHLHTSAGRTPTEAGLKIYVDEILAVGHLSQEVRSLIDHQLSGGAMRTESVLALCSKVLSNITRHMGVVASPALGRLPLKQLYFVRLASKEVLAILEGENGLVRNKVLTTTEDYSQDSLNQVNAYLADIGQDMTLDEIRLKLLSSLRTERQAFDALYFRALELVQDCDHSEPGNGAETQPIYLEGRGNLVANPEFAEAEAMRTLFTVFEDKSRILALLNEVAESGQVRIVVGPEAAAAAMSGLSLVASPYTRGDRVVGALGIIGPQRLDYSEIVPMVGYAARVVSGLLDAD